MRLLSTASRITLLSKRVPTEMLVALNGIEEPAVWPIRLAQLNLGLSKRQELLEELSVRQRLYKISLAPLKSWNPEAGEGSVCRCVADGSPEGILSAGADR